MATRWIFGSQLNHQLPIVKDADQDKDVFLFVEAHSRSTWQSYHKQKLVLIFSAMRHFAEELKEKGYTVDYREADSFQDAWENHRNEYKPDQIYYTAHTDYRMKKAMEKWQDSLPENIEVTVLSDQPLFLLTAEEAQQELKGDGPWKMDPFYRKLRKRYSVLVEDDKPVGGKWSFDQDNRKSAKSGTSFPKEKSFRPDDITKEVMKKVAELFGDTPGDLEPFRWPVTRKEALQALNHFCKERLETFGTYQDAMLIDNPYMSHSLLSSSINIGLITPLEVIQKVEDAKTNGAPLNSVEGFIRQILGWREYIRAVYLKTMPEYKKVNELNHQVDLPSFFWDGQSNMTCMEQSLKPVVASGYNHHIQRLMVLGNFANLFGISPQQTADWFNEMYIDAYDWVVLPNVLGMALYADGGKLSTKPYVSSGKYIHKMSNYCTSCPYNVNHQLEEDACPFNALYWNFLDRHAEKLSRNPRMGLIYSQWSKKEESQKTAIRKKAAALKQELANGRFHEKKE
ncbi:cryptochrome/photolyase family protein [Jeotgalibacillus aurantiacus]|uniref:cryptochrome/photolyase family protein n=1 Tax=Jeotgalibacillus aurantiacus TaxID=2763266 RepID=UPI001D0AA008|nr:cryptochrome/photolyase family protein [Jeotgalibacillus aurantiacus]